MIRVLGRTAVILVLAAAVAALLYAAVGAGGPSSPEEHFTPADPALPGDHFAHGPEDWDGRRPGRGERHAREEASVGRGIFGAIGTAVQIGLVGAGVVVLQRRSRRLRDRRRSGK